MKKLMTTKGVNFENIDDSDYCKRCRLTKDNEDSDDCKRCRLKKTLKVLITGKSAD